jgi:hypothetical protein
MADDPSKFSNSRVRHGTYSGWNKHQTRGEPPCDACYRAKADYDHRRRETSDVKLRQRVLARAQHRAVKELAHRHPDEYRQLYLRFKAELLEAEGIAP